MITLKKKRDFRWKERGNVLFLILIAVALFAALSYAVTSSSRSGGGDANSETNLISSAQITQYPATVRTSIIRMVVSNNVSADVLEFNRPADFGDLDTDEHGVFHPEGGNATYATAPSDIMNTGTGATNAAGDWFFNAENEILFVGRSTAAAGADASPPLEANTDIVAFLPDIKESICRRINEELGITGIPTEANVEMDGHNMGTISGTTTGICDTACAGTTIGGAVADLDAQPFGCFQQPAGTYHYYHVLVER